MFVKMTLVLTSLMLLGPMLPSTRVTVLVGDQYVNYTDLRIITDVGGDRLLRRIRLAADEFCVPAEDGAQRTCRHEAMTRAVASLRSSAVTARLQWEMTRAVSRPCEVRQH